MASQSPPRSLPPSLPQWVRSLHPDVFVAADGDNDVTGPFSVPQVRRIYDYTSNYFHCNDAFCHDGRFSLTSLTPLPRIDGTRVENLQQLDCNCDPLDACLESEVRMGASATESFRFGLPQLRLRSPDSTNNTVFMQPIDRQHMLVFERFLFQRQLIVVLAMDGEMQYLRLWPHDKWVAALRRHGFVLSPIVPTVTHQMIKMSKAYQRYVRVMPATGGMKLDAFDRDALSASFWTV